MADIEDVKRVAFFALMVIGPYVMHRMRRTGAARASREYPALARELGLSLRAAEPGRIGALSGDYDGYRVFVDPDDRARIVVYTHTEPRVVLRTFEHEKRVPNELVSATTPNRVAERFFKDCYAAEDVAHALAERAGELEPLLRPFAERWPRTVRHLSITPERLECELDFGRPTHIPEDVVKALLPAAVALLRFVESL